MAPRDRPLTKMSRQAQKQPQLTDDRSQETMRALHGFFAGLDVTLNAICFEGRKPIGPHRSIRYRCEGVRHI
jgi:hypothetical protein